MYRFDFLVGDEELDLIVALGDESRLSDEEAARRASYATFILESVCDRFELASDDSGAHLRTRQDRAVGAADAD